MPLAAGEISSKNAPVSTGMRGVPRLKGPAARAREGQLPMLPAPAVAAAKASKNSRLVKPLIGFCFSCEVCSVSVAFLLAVWAFRCFVRQASRRRGRTVAHHTRPMAYRSVARDHQPLSSGDATREPCGKAQRLQRVGFLRSLGLPVPRGF